ncbi:MAG: penicillin-binding protein 2 [Patescibacteria group bacterium]
MHKNRQKSPKNRRINAFIIFIFIFVALIVLRLFDLQILKYKYYQALASGQHQIFEEITPSRGEIYIKDRFSKELYPLALNKKLNLIFAVPNQIEDKKEFVQKLAPLLEIKEKELEKKLSSGSSLYAPLKHKVSDEIAEKIKALNLKGIYFQKESWRFYPDKEFAAQVLGFVGFENDKQKGFYGIEGYYDGILRGKEGHFFGEKDALGKLTLIGSKFMEKAEDGASVVLTLDRLLQFQAEKAIAEGAQRYGADRGCAVVIDPKTGEILAMAIYPTFDPNKYYEVKNMEVFRNSIIYDLYEPGSVIKPLVMAVALDLGLVSPQTKVLDRGEIKVDKFAIRNFDGKANGEVTMTKVLEQSINVGMVQVGQMVGKKRLYEYFDKFGFLNLSGVDLDSEMPSRIKSYDLWANSDLATASFGQGFSINALQLASAYTAIANSGKLIMPHIVEKIVYPSGREEIVRPQESQQIISSSTASTLSAMLTSVVENGQAALAKVPGYQIAGKGGTAQVPKPDSIGYDPSKRITSFVGFGPVEDPKFVILVKLDNPKGNVFGVETAGPVFAKLAQDLLQYYQVPPSE